MKKEIKEVKKLYPNAELDNKDMGANIQSDYIWIKPDMWIQKSYSGNWHIVELNGTKRVTDNFVELLDVLKIMRERDEK